MAGIENEPGNESVKTREELIDESIEIGIPVARHENKITLEMFLGSADEDDFDDDFDDDLDDEIDEPLGDKDIEDFDFDEDDDLFDDDDPQYN